MFYANGYPHSIEVQCVEATILFLCFMRMLCVARRVLRVSRDIYRHRIPVGMTIEIHRHSIRNASLAECVRARGPFLPFYIPACKYILCGTLRSRRHSIRHTRLVKYKSFLGKHTFPRRDLSAPRRRVNGPGGNWFVPDTRTSARIKDRKNQKNSFRFILS